MKTKLFALGLLGLGLLGGSCAKDDAGEVKGGTVVPGQPAVATVTFTIASSESTRAEVAPGEGLATDDESDVQNVAVLLTSEDGKVVYAYTLSVNKKENSANTYVSDEFETVSGSFKAYVVANPPAKMSFAAGMDVTSALLQAAEYDGGATNCEFANNGSFVMINQAAEAFEISEAGPNNLSVDVERVVAKVTFASYTESGQTTANTYKTDDYGSKVVIESVALANMNKVSYLTRHDAPGWTSTVLTYVADPNYEITEKDGDKVAEFYNSNPASWSHLYDPNAKSGTGEADKQHPDATSATTGIYCLENTFPAGQVKWCDATYAVYNAKYTPASGAFYKPKEDSYYEDLANAAAPNYKWAESCSDDGTFYVYDNNFFGNEDNLKFYMQLAANVLEYQSADADKQAEIAAEVTNTVVDTENAKKYDKGACYYAVAVRHNTHSSVGFYELGKYGVVRNHWYELTVTSVSGVGEPSPDPDKVVTPDDPIDQTTIKATVEVTIMPWNFIQQNVEL